MDRNTGSCGPVDVFVGFKYADYRHAQTTTDILLMEELVEEEESQKLASQEESSRNDYGACKRSGRNRGFEMQEGAGVSSAGKGPSGYRCGYQPAQSG